MDSNTPRGRPSGIPQPALVSVIAEAEKTGKLDIWTTLYNSKAIFIVIILLYLFCGTIFYKYYDHMTWSEAYYYSVNCGFRIGYSTPKSDIDEFSKIISVFFKLIGVCILAFFYTVLLRSSYFQRSDVRLTRLLTSLLIAVVVLVFGSLWSYLVIDWSFMNGVYFVFSTCFWWGVYSVPTDSSGGALAMTATLAIVGGLAVFIFFAFLAANIEVYIENHLIDKASKQAITSTDLGIIEKLLTKERQRRDQAAQNDPLKFVDKDRDVEDEEQEELEEDEEDAALLEAGASETLLSKSIVEHLILIRILSLDDVSRIYYHVRMWLIAAFALCLLVTMLFYKLYDGSQYWCLSLNYAVSSFYRLGFSNGDVDSFSEIVSTFVMLVGCVLFNLLNVCITREFGLKARDIRYFHTLLDGILILTFCSLTIAMFLDAYSWSGVQSFVFAVDIMMGYGDNVPSGKSIWSYWLLDCYSIAIIPLFVAYVSHVEVELDIGDALGYMNRALSLNFDRHDLRLVQIHDDYVDKRYAVMGNERGHRPRGGSSSSSAAAGTAGDVVGGTISRTNSVASELSYVEEEDLSLSRNEFGTFELHVLLVLRLKDMSKEQMRAMVVEVNKSYRQALNEGLEVFHCYNDDDVRIVDSEHPDDDGASFYERMGGSSSEQRPKRSATPERRQSSSGKHKRRSSRPRVDSNASQTSTTRQPV